MTRRMHLGPGPGKALQMPSFRGRGDPVERLTMMMLVFDIGDRFRLRERFFGAARSVLARS